MGKGLCPIFLQPLLKNTNRRSCNYGSRKIIPVSHNPHRRCRHYPSAVGRTLVYLVGIRINIQKTREYLEGVNQVSPKSTPQQSLFVGEVLDACYQTFFIYYRWLISAKGLCEKTEIPHSRCGHTKAPYKGISGDFVRSWKERLIMRINGITLLIHFSRGL